MYILYIITIAQAPTHSYTHENKYDFTHTHTHTHTDNIKNVLAHFYVYPSMPVRLLVSIGQCILRPRTNAHTHVYVYIYI